MSSLWRIVRSVLSAGLLLIPSAAPVNGQTPRHEWLKSCRVALVGKIVTLGDVSFADVPRSPRTMVVIVDEVLEKAAAVWLGRGEKVTVEVKEPLESRAGDLVTFCARGWIFGDGIAVQVGHETSLGARRATREELAQVRKELSDAELRSRIQRADIVVVGRVTAIRRIAMRTVGEQPNVRVSEHDPDWQEAIVEVESEIKGARDGQEIVIRFPGSLDVAWYGFPKFKPGQEGTFFLQKDCLSGSPKAILAGAEVNAYIAGSRQDVLAKSEEQRVRTLMQQ